MAENTTVPPQPPQPPKAANPEPEESFGFRSAFGALESKPLWKQLWEEVHDLVAPPKQPDLKLESKPVPVKDIWSRDEKALTSRMTSVGLHVVVLGLIILVVALKPVRKEITQVVTPIFVPNTPPPPPPPDVKVLKLAKGGAPMPNAPKIIPVRRVPQALAAPSAIVPLAMATSQLPSFGDSNAVGGPPGPGGGDGSGGGVGAGGNCDPTKEDDCVLGTGVAAPEPIYSPDPEYSEEGRKAKIQGTVQVKITIGTDGRVIDATPVPPELGFGLDEKAVQTVKTWRFKPALWMGKAIMSQAVVDVTFHLY